MEVKAQGEVFTSILDRIMNAPVNLFHDVTPVSRILGYFNSDIPELDSHMFRMSQELIKIQIALIGNTLITLKAIPHLFFVFAFQNFFKYRIDKAYKEGKHIVDEGHGPRHEAVSNHVKLSYTGKAVINAYKKQDSQLKVLQNFYTDMIIWERLAWSYHLRSEYLKHFCEYPSRFLTYIVCLHMRG
jgi:hypothetical protein